MAPTPNPLPSPNHSVASLYERGIGVARWWKKLTQSSSAESYELEVYPPDQSAATSRSAPQLPELDLGPDFDTGAFNLAQRREPGDGQPHGNSHFLLHFQSKMKLIEIKMLYRPAGG